MDGLIVGERVRAYVGPEADSEIIEAVRRGGGDVAEAGDANAIIWLSRDPAPLLDLLHPGIVWIQLPSAGVERFVAAGVISACPLCTSAGPAYATSVAEHAVALMLGCARNFRSVVGAESWKPDSIRMLRGASVAIIGAGRVGRALITLLEPFAVHVSASTSSGREVPGAEHSVGSSASMEIASTADFVVAAAPLTPHTRGMFDRAAFRRLRDDAYVINVARGPLIVTSDLVSAVLDHEIGGAGLDVTDPEPLPTGHPLWSMERVLITPHMANTFEQATGLLTVLVEENVRRRGLGQQLLGEISSERGY